MTFPLPISASPIHRPPFFSDWNTPYAPVPYISGSPTSSQCKRHVSSRHTQLLLSRRPRHHHLLEPGSRSAPILARTLVKIICAFLLSVHSNSNLSFTRDGHRCCSISRLQLRCLSCLYWLSAACTFVSHLNPPLLFYRIPAESGDIIELDSKASDINPNPFKPTLLYPFHQPLKSRSTFHNIPSQPSLAHSEPTPIQSTISYADSSIP